MSNDNELAETIGKLSTSLASIKEQVQNMGADLTEKVKAGGEVSAAIKEEADKALSKLGDDRPPQSGPVGKLVQGWSLHQR